MLANVQMVTSLDIMAVLAKISMNAKLDIFVEMQMKFVTTSEVAIVAIK